MMCPICGGRMGSYAGNAAPSRSKAITQLISDLGPTCFCRATAEQLESLIMISDERLEELTKEHFPQAKSKEEVRKKLMELPRNDMLRISFFKRMEYSDLLQAALEKKMRNTKTVKTSIGRGMKAKKPINNAPLPKRAGGSISDWLKDLD